MSNPRSVVGQQCPTPAALGFARACPELVEACPEPVEGGSAQPTILGPLSLVGEGQGEGVLSHAPAVAPPLPDLPPQGGKEPKGAAKSGVIAVRSSASLLDRQNLPGHRQKSSASLRLQTRGRNRP